MSVYSFQQTAPQSNLVPPGSLLGMGQSSPYRYEAPRTAPQSRRPIDFLAPNTPQHQFVLDYLLQRLNYSEWKMAQFYPRWQANEMRHQAYITLPQYEDIMRRMRDERVPPAPESIVVPYSWATHNTIVTYLLHTFGGRKPIVQVGSYRPEQVHRAKNMETLLQYNYDYVRYIYRMYQLFTDGELYGVSIQRNAWSQEKKRKTLTQPASPQLVSMMSFSGMQAPEQRVTQDVVCFEGNAISAISPYMFFPDPRVPMVDVAEKGEYVFWRAFEGRHLLLRAEAMGQLQWVKYAGEGVVNNFTSGSDSHAGLRALGESLTGGPNNPAGQPFGASAPIQVDQGTVEIIPSELGLGDGRIPEKWLFTILNKRQIVQAERQDANHGAHPVSVAEPNSFGHSFGQLSTADMNAPIQDLLSWMVNSHMFNVRAVLNNLILVDPNRVEIDDFNDPMPGGIVRMKTTPFGQTDARMAAQQFQIGDVTRSHLADFGFIQRVGNDLTGATDNIRGMQDAGGRKTATEVRTSYEAGGSRLASRAMLYGQMQITPGAIQQVSNYQQYLSQEVELRVLGAEGAEHSVRIDPYGIEGDFYFPLHDGTLPMDKMALMGVWKEIFQLLVQDPTGQMQQQYNAPAVFRFLAKMSGAQNIDEFSTTAVSPAAIDGQVQRGNLVPLSAVPGQIGGALAGPQQPPVMQGEM